MSMTREQMLAGLQRLFVIQYFKPEEIGPYGDVIYEACSWMDSYRFDASVKEVLKTLKTNQRLKPAHFLGAYRQLAEQHGWHRTETKTCASCGGAEFVHIWVKDKKEHEFRAVKGCPECNPKYNVVHPDFTELTGPSFEPINTIAPLRKLPPAFAQLLLDIADSSKISIKSEETVDALCYAAAQPVAKQMVRRPNPAIRENQLIRQLIEAPPVKVIEAGTAQEEPAKTEPPPAPAEEPSPAAVTDEFVQQSRRISAEEAAAEGVPF